MIDTTVLVDCAFSDWGEPLENLETNYTTDAIYDDMDDYSKLGLGSFNHGGVYILIRPAQASNFQEKQKVKLTNRDETFIIERIKKDESNIVKLLVSKYDELENYNAYDFTV